VEEAVKERLFELTVERVKNRNASTDQGELMRLIDDAAEAVRTPSNKVIKIS
jgi:hypothetical protein